MDQEALIVVREYVERLRSSDASAWPPGSGVEWAAADLAAAVAPEHDLEAALVLGTYHWLCAGIRARQGGGADGVAGSMDAVLRFILPVYWSRPDLVPETLRAALAKSPELAVLARGEPRELSAHAQALVMQFERTGRLDDLRSAATYFRAAAAASIQDPDLLQRLNNLGVCLRDLYARTEDPDVLDQAILSEGSALELGRGRPGYGARVASLEHVLTLRAERTGTAGTYQEVIDAVRGALDGLSADDPERASVLSTLAGALGKQFLFSRDPEILEQSVQAIREAVDLTPPDDPGRKMFLVNLTIALAEQIRHAPDTRSLADMAQAQRELVRLTPPADPDHPARLASLGNALQELYHSAPDPVLLDEMVQVERAAVACPGGRTRLPLLGLTLRVRHARTHRTEDLEEAVSALREAAADDEGLTDLLGATLCSLYHATQRPEHLREAVTLGRRSLTTPGSDDALRPDWLDDLNCLLQLRYGQAGDLADLQDAVLFGRAAVAESPDAGRLTNLGGALISMHAGTGDPALLEEALTCEREAVRLTPADHPSRAKYLHNLAGALHRRYELAADAGDLEAAVEIHREAMACAAPDDPDRALFLSDLGGALRSLYVAISETSLLEEAVEAERQAVELTAHRPVDQARHRHNLAGALQALYQRTERVEVLDEAIALARESVEAAPAGRPERAQRLVSLTGLLRMRYDHDDRLESIEEAIALAREALRLSPHDHPARAQRLNNLSVMLLIGHKNAGSVSIREAGTFDDPIADTIGRLVRTLPLLRPEVLDEAIETAREAAERTPVGHPDRAKHLYNLAMALTSRPQHVSDEETLRSLREAAEDQTAQTALRITAHRQYGHHAARAGDALAGLRAIEEAVDLVDTLAPRSLLRSDREFQLGHLTELPGEAAAIALQADQPRRALELLERTRGVLAADALALRSEDHARLHARAPELADRLNALRARLSALDHVSPENGGPDAEHQARHRRETHEAIDELLHRIRAVPGLEDFMSPPSAGRLLPHLGSRGPVAVVTASRLRSDALILTADEIQVVPLPGLTADNALDQANRLLAAHRTAADREADPGRRISAQRQILDILAWLWDVAAEPILTRLGHTARPCSGEPWPRIWWCPVGVLAFLPLHAAGHHVPGGATVLDTVVSSYTPTAAALGHARSRGPSPAVPSTVIIPVPDSAAVPLPGARRETAAISSHIERARVLHDPTREAVLRALRTHDIVHFACHAETVGTDPGSSRLILADTPLTVRDISALNLDAALGFLAACDTSVSSYKLADEAIHITGALQLAGFRHVIGTTWKVEDQAAAEFSTAFYAHLTDQGTPAVDRCAAALHHTVRHMRDRYPNTPTLWAPYTHYGP